LIFLHSISGTICKRRIIFFGISNILYLSSIIFSHKTKIN
jgi:hypothetical protein